MTRRHHIVGLSIEDFGKSVFGGAHMAGSVLAKAFGAGALVAPIENLESPYLPDWAKGTAAAIATHVATVAIPDYVVVVHTDASKAPDVLIAPDTVSVSDGKRFDGNGYKKGEAPGKSFSFGYDAPSKVDLTTKGKKTSLSGVKQVLFLGGQEAKTTVAGETMDHRQLADQILGELATGEVIDAVGDYDWRAIFYDPAGELYRSQNPSGNAYEVPQAAQNAYFAQQRAAAATSPLMTAAAQRLAASQQLQAALRAQQASNTAALMASARAQLPPPGPTSYALPLATQPMLPPFAATPAAPMPDLNNPGYLTDGTIDPNFLTPTAIVGLERSRPMSKYLQGVDVLGAVASPLKKIPRAAFVMKTAPATGRKFTSLQLNRSAKHDPKKTLAAARAVAKRAQQVGTKALAAIKKMPAATKTTKVIGAAGHPVKKLGPAALKAETQKLLDAGKKLTGTADKYDKALTAAVAKARAGAAKAQQVTKIHGDEGYTVGTGRFGTHMPQFGTHAPDFGTRVVGDDFDEAYWEEIVGDDGDFDAEMLEAAAMTEIVGLAGDVPDPNNPGYYTPSGTPIPVQPGDVADPLNPGYMVPSGAMDPSYGSGAYGATGVPGPPDYGAGPAPTLASVAPVAGLDFSPDPYPNGDDPTFWDCPTDADLPLGAIVFDGSQQPPFQGLGNFTVFQGMLPGSGPPKGGPNSGYSYHGDDGWWLLLQGTQPSFNYSGGKNYDHVANPDAAMVAESKKNNWGPLMGNPQGGWTHGLRFSPSGPSGSRWFWFFDTAMAVAPWAVQAILQARLNEAIVAYQAAVTAGQTDFVNQQIQDQLDAKTASDQSRAQAAQDAQLALQQQQQDAQEAAYEQQAQQQDYSLQQQAMQAQLQQMQQQSAIDNQVDSAQAAYFAQNPDLMFAQVPVDQGGGAPDYGAVDDGSADFGDSGGDVEDGVDWGADDRNQLLPEG